VSYSTGEGEHPLDDAVKDLTVRPPCISVQGARERFLDRLYDLSSDLELTWTAPINIVSPHA
jgi:hypothetical protein